MLARFLAPARLLLAAALLLAVACGVGCVADNSPAPGDARHELAVHRAMWRATGLADYDLRLRQVCFCPPEVTNPVDIRVTGGAVVEAWRDPGHELIDTGFGMTVEALFDRVAFALEEEGVQVEVSYSASLGYPEEISINRPGVPDGYWGAYAELLCRPAGVDSTVACDCTSGPGTREYAFTALDGAGVVIVSGCLGLTFAVPANPAEPGGVSGARCLRPACARDVPDAFPGEWSVAGSISPDGEITLDLNSGVADFNIFLNGRFAGKPGEAGDFSGEWSYSTIAGPQATGRFTATRRS